MPNHLRSNEELFDYHKLRSDLTAFVDRYGGTQKSLATLIGVSAPTLSRILSGDTAIMTVPTLFAVCILLNVNPAHYATEHMAEYTPELHGLSYAAIIAHMDETERGE